jgi:hypothetical protein
LIRSFSAATFNLSMVQFLNHRGSNFLKVRPPVGHDGPGAGRRPAIPPGDSRLGIQLDALGQPALRIAARRVNQSQVVGIQRDSNVAGRGDPSDKFSHDLVATEFISIEGLAHNAAGGRHRQVNREFLQFIERTAAAILEFLHGLEHCFQ